MVVVDAHSRRVVGWELGATLQASLPLQALDRALADRVIEPGIVHHSDQGVQYCCPDYVGRLQDHGFVIAPPYGAFLRRSTTENDCTLRKGYRPLEELEAAAGNGGPQAHNEEEILYWGLCPHPPGI